LTVLHEAAEHGRLASINAVRVSGARSDQEAVRYGQQDEKVANLTASHSAGALLKNVRAWLMYR